MTNVPARLVDEGVALLTKYLEDHRTDHLKALATVIVRLRGEHRADAAPRTRAEGGGRHRRTAASV